MTSGIRKLIEVSMPLEAINKASAWEKSIQHGHPSTLHLWWAWQCWLHVASQLVRHACYLKLRFSRKHAQRMKGACSDLLGAAL